MFCRARSSASEPPWLRKRGSAPLPPAASELTKFVKTHTTAAVTLSISSAEKWAPISRARVRARPRVSSELWAVPMYAQCRMLLASTLGSPRSGSDADDDAAEEEEEEEGGGAATPSTRRTSAATASSPSRTAAQTSWHMTPTIAAVLEESAPPLSGRK